MSQGDGPRVPTKPFVDWLNKRLKTIERDYPPRAENGLSLRGLAPLTPLQCLASELGTSERTVFRYLKSRGYLRDKHRDQPVDTFDLGAVERLLDNAGVRLGDIYPEYDFAAIELEPDARCAGCEDIVTPINKHCPWCGRRTSIITVEHAKRARELVTQGYPMTAVARTLIPELGNYTVNHVAKVLRDEFETRGWSAGLGVNASRKRVA